MSSINTSLTSLGVARSLATAQNQLATAMFRLSTALPNPEEKPSNQSDQVSLNIGRYLGGLDEQLRSLSESLAIGQSAEAMVSEVSIALDALSGLVTNALDPELDDDARQRLQQEAEAVRTRLDARVAADALPERASDQKVSSSDDSDSEGLPAAVPRIDVMTPEGALESAERIEEARETLRMFQERIGVILDRLEASATNLRQITESFSTAQSLERLRATIEQRSGQWGAVHDKANKAKVLLLLRPDEI